MPLLTVLVNGVPVDFPLPADPSVRIEIKTTDGLKIEIKTENTPQPVVVVDGVTRA